MASARAHTEASLWTFRLVDPERNNNNNNNGGDIVVYEKAQALICFAADEPVGSPPPAAKKWAGASQGRQGTEHRGVDSSTRATPHLTAPGSSRRMSFLFLLRLRRPRLSSTLTGLSDSTVALLPSSSSFLPLLRHLGAHFLRGHHHDSSSLPRCVVIVNRFDIRSRANFGIPGRSVYPRRTLHSCEKDEHPPPSLFSFPFLVFLVVVFPSCRVGAPVNQTIRPHRRRLIPGSARRSATG